VRSRLYMLFCILLTKNGVLADVRVAAGVAGWAPANRLVLLQLRGKSGGPYTFISTGKVCCYAINNRVKE